MWCFNCYSIGSGCLSDNASPPNQRTLFTFSRRFHTALCSLHNLLRKKKKKRKALCIVGKSTAGSLVRFFFFLNQNDIFGFLQVPRSLADDARRLGRITADCRQSRQLQMQPEFPSSFHGSYTVSDFSMHFPDIWYVRNIYCSILFAVCKLRPHRFCFSSSSALPLQWALFSPFPFCSLCPKTWVRFFFF